MDRETFEKQKEYGGEKKPSMTRRMVEHDYTDRRMYMLTMITEGRRPLFGKVVGKSDALQDSPDAPRCELSELGKAVSNEWQGIPKYYPEIKVLALQMMPDHLHAILFVKERMEKPLGKVLLGVKQACNQAFREVMPVKCVAVAQQHAEQKDGNTQNKERHRFFSAAPLYYFKFVLGICLPIFPNEIEAQAQGYQNDDDGPKKMIAHHSQNPRRMGCNVC